MKGIVFTEFLEMAEERFSLATVDAVIEHVKPASGGSYTAVGTYPVEELVSLLSELSRQTGAGVPALLKDFGGHLFGRFVETQPGFFTGVRSTFAFLRTVEGHIHVEVRKLYPDAQLPSFECSEDSDTELFMTYRSPRRLADLAEGLMYAAAAHYGERIDVTREDLSQGRGEHVRFHLKLQGAA